MIPDAIALYFWDVDVARLDLVKHKDYIIERLMSRGDLNAMRWLRRTFGQADLHEFVVRRGRERLAPRELAYWALIVTWTWSSAPVEADPIGPADALAPVLA